MKPVMIFDIDGTLAITQHRQHFVKNNNWKDFFSHMGNDEPVAAIFSLYKTLYHSRDFEIHIFTGRPEKSRNNGYFGIIYLKHRYICGCLQIIELITLSKKKC